MRKNITRSSYYRHMKLLWEFIAIAQSENKFGIVFNTRLHEENNCIDGWVYTYAFEYNGSYRVYTLMQWYNPNTGQYQFTVNSESQGIS